MLYEASFYLQTTAAPAILSNTFAEEKVPTLLPTKLYRIERGISLLLLLTAVGLWLFNYAAGRSLFLDEANLALNIAERDWEGFFRRLDYEQYAPPLFLVLVKTACELVGYSVWGLRLVPLLAGLATLGLSWFLPKQLGTPALRPLLFGLLLANEYTLRYFTESKQYGFDIFIATGLFYLALAQPTRLTPRWTLIWALTGLLAVWSSMPSIFLLAGIGGWGLWRDRHQRETVLRWLVVGGLWLASFGCYYWLLLRADSLRPELAEWHRPYFFPLLPQSGSDWQRVGSLLVSLLRTGFGHTVWMQSVAGLSLFAGVGLFLRKDRRLAAYTLLPIGLAFLAAGLEKYSLLPRLLLFALPLLWAVSLRGTQLLVDRSRRTGLLIAGVIWSIALIGSRNSFSGPARYDTTRELLTHLELDPGSPAYVSHLAEPAVRYYQEWHPATDALPPALSERTIRYGTNERSALSQLLTDQPAAAEMLYSHPNPDVARQYLLTTRRKLEQAGYSVRIIDESYNGWVVRVRR